MSMVEVAFWIWRLLFTLYRAGGKGQEDKESAEIDPEAAGDEEVEMQDEREEVVICIEGNR